MIGEGKERITRCSKCNKHIHSSGHTPVLAEVHKGNLIIEIVNCCEEAEPSANIQQQCS